MAPPVQTETFPVVSDVGPEPQNTEPSKSGKAIVGIIYPPPEIRNIVDKTANFVARNGLEFENKIRDKEAKNPKFNFLTPTDPYYAYYQHKVREVIEGKVIETQSIPKPTAPVAPLKVQEALKAAEFTLKDPPPEFEFVADPATINAFDLDLIKLTAMFVARNGRQFLTQLMQREARNFQFDFLKPQHSNFSYFTKLVEQYTKILIPPKDMVERLRRELSETKNVLETVKYRVEWERHQKRIREREEAEAEKERLAYAQIAWHDFVVVQTVDFQPNETVNLPPPCNPKDVGARILAIQRMEATKSAAQTVEMEVESGSEGESDDEDKEPKTVGDHSSTEPQQPNQISKQKFPTEVLQPIPAPPNPDNVVIRKDYNPRVKQLEKAKAVEQNWVISPLTGEKIPADKLAEHMKFNTVDQQYFVQKEREIHDRQEEEPAYAPGQDITDMLRHFADRRSDIFGVGSKGAEQTVIGKKLGEDDKPRQDPKAIWDGHTASVEATTKAAQSHVSIEDQIAQIHRSQGLLPDQDKERIGPKSTDTSFKESQQTHAVAPMPPSQPSQAAMMASSLAHAAAFNAARQQPMATMMPVMQMTPTPVVLVQQPTLIKFLRVVGGLYATGQLTHQPPSAYNTFGQQPFGQMPHPSYAPQMQQQMMEEEPASKKMKTSEDQLVPEEEWMNMYAANGPVTIVIQCPNAGDKQEWNLNGQTMNVPFDLKEPISNVKTKIQEVTGLPASKQKLVYEGFFVKDQQSLGFYNMLSGSVIQLQLKERGGRKK